MCAVLDVCSYRKSRDGTDDDDITCNCLRLQEIPNYCEYMINFLNLLFACLSLMCKAVQGCLGQCDRGKVTRFANWCVTCVVCYATSAVQPVWTKTVCLIVPQSLSQNDPI